MDNNAIDDHEPLFSDPFRQWAWRCEEEEEDESTVVGSHHHSPLGVASMTATTTTTTKDGERRQEIGSKSNETKVRMTEY